MAKKLFIALLLILQVCVYGNSFQEKILTFANLSEDEKVVIKYRTSGCFHNFSSEFEVKGNSPIKVKVWDLVRKGEKIKKKYVGEKYLSGRDVYKLDRLLVFYRKSPKLGCTTQDDVELIWYKKNQELLKEKIADGSCEVHDLEDVLTLDDLRFRIRSK